MDTRRIGEAPGSIGPVNNRRLAGDRLHRATANYHISRILRSGMLMLLTSVCLDTVASHAQDATWLSNPGSGDWNTNANWTPAAAPTGTATFDASSTTAITFSSLTTTVGTLQFNGAQAYSFNLLASNTLTITGTGIVNNSSNSPIFSVTGNVVPVPAAFLHFQGASTAGNATITNSNRAATEFFDSSTAGTATFINGNLGGTFFHDASTGGQATFITNVGGFFDISQLTSAGTTAGSIEGGGTYLLGAKALTVGSNNHSTEVSGSIADDGLGGGAGGALIKVGTGTLTLSGTNSYTGGTLISTGTLRAGSITGLSPSSAFTVNSFLDLNGFNNSIASLSGSTNGAVTNNGTAPAVLTTGSFPGVATQFNGNLQNGTSSLGLYFVGGTMLLGGNNTYSGATTINGGSLRAGSLTAFSSNSAFTVNSVLDLNGFNNSIASLSGNTNGAVTNTGGSPAVLTTGGDNSSTTFSGTLTDGSSSSLGLTKTGTGTLTLTSTNTYSGGTSFNGGTLAVNNDANLGTGPLSFDGGTLEALAVVGGGGITSSRAITLDGGGGTFQADISTTSTLSGTISGTGAFTKTGTGTLTLTGANTYNGGTVLNAGTLNVGGTQALGLGNVVVNGGNLDFLGGSTAANSAITNNAGFTIFNDTSTAGNATITTNNGGSTVFIRASMGGNANFITNAGGKVDISGLSSGGTTAGSIEGAGTYFLGSKTLTVGSDLSTQVSGTIVDGGFGRGTGGALIKVGTGTLTLTGTNTYSGGTSFNGGTLAVDNDANLGTGPLSFNGGTLEALAFGGGINSSKAITLNGGGGTFSADTGTTSTLSSVIGGTGAFTKAGAGMLILTGANTYSGGTTISAGTLQAGSTTAFSPNSAFTVNSVLDLNGNSNAVGSLTGSGTVTNNGVTPATLTAGGHNSNTTFSGTLIDGSGSLGFTKTGTGTLILAGSNTYFGGTTISAGTLQAGSTRAFSPNSAFTVNSILDLNGNSNTVGSLAGSGTVTNNGKTPATLTAGGGNSSTTFSGALSDGSSSLGFTKTGTGTTILSGMNTYTGGTVVNAGALTVSGAQALGLGDVVVNGGILNADPQPINVKGNYTQNAGGTLQLQVAGANRGQYDTLNVGGSAKLNGVLQPISLGYVPQSGDSLGLVTAKGSVSGQFTHFIDPFTARPGLNTIDLVYGRNFVQLQFLDLTSPISPVIPVVPTTPATPGVTPPNVVATINFASFALTPNQHSSAGLADQVELNPKAAGLVGFLLKEPFTNLPGDFDKISPEGLTAFYEIGFSNSNIQRLTLEGRLDELRGGSSGFSSNMKVNGASVNLEAGVDGKSSKGVVEPVLRPARENRWGVWVTGFGDFVSVDADANAAGYNFTTGGVSLGVDYRLTDSLAIGAMGEYSHTWTSLNPSGSIDVNSGRGGLYASWFSHGIYLNGAIYGGGNSYSSARSGLGGLANGSTSGAEWSTFISGGYDFRLGHLTVGPIAALQYSYVNINGFSENGSLAPMQIQSNSVDSLRSDVGFRIFYQWQIGKIVLEPSLKAAWEHEYEYSALPITAGFAGIPGPSATFFGPNEGHDSAVVSAGVSAQLTPAISTYINYDGQLGRGNYDSNAVTGGFRISF